MYKKWVIWLIIRKNRDVILNRARDYYENNKEKLRSCARDKYKNLSGEEKNKKRKYGKSRYHDMSEEKKTKRIWKKIIVRLKRLNIIINKIVF